MKMIVKKSGWSKSACLLGPIWYLKKRLFLKGSILLLLCVCTAGLGIIPVWIYCGYNGNRDHYIHLKRNHAYILEYQRHRV